MNTNSASIRTDRTQREDQELVIELNELKETVQEAQDRFDSFLHKQELKLNEARTEYSSRIRQLELDIDDIEAEVRRRRINNRNVFLDADGEKIDIGDYVNILTQGVWKARSGTVVETNRRRFITVLDKNGIGQRREPHKLQIVKKHNEQRDRRPRYD